MHAKVSLTSTFTKKGIAVAPELYHQILYAHSAVKHGITKMERILSDRCNYIQITLVK